MESTKRNYTDSSVEGTGEGHRYASSFKEQLTIRGIITGAFGSIIITTSSMYVALRMGSLPWPIILLHCCQWRC